MSKNNLILSIGTILLTIFMGITPAVTGTPYSSNFGSTSRTVEYHQYFSDPGIIENEEFIEVVVKETDYYNIVDGTPMLPIFSKTFEFPFGTKIVDVEFTTSNVDNIIIGKQIKPIPSKQKIGDSVVNIEGILNKEIYSSDNPFPSKWLDYKTGAGLNKQNNHVLFLTLYINPIKYIPNKNIIQHINQIDVKITYDIIKFQTTNLESFDMVVISPSEFSSNLDSFVNHKNSYGIETTLVTLESIYENYSGRDKAEKIKYFIKDAVDKLDCKYVLLIGDIKKLPTRTSFSSPWNMNGLLTDIYYADVYNDDFKFCSWDSNENNRFGEVHDSGWPPINNDQDGVDLYADVNIGRIPCSNGEELDTVLKKIVNYEKETFGKTWFNNMVLIGGDTFPLRRFGRPFVYEGEITNAAVAEQLPDFKHIKLWTSKHNLNALTFNLAITKGAGFVSYAGHGFEMGWGTYRPNAISKIMISYYTPYLNGMKNNEKLPILFFDACLTGKLDFNVSDLNHYFPLLTKFLLTFTNLENDPSIFYPCFAWSFLKKENGGSIATIGATRVAYTWVDENGVHAGAGLLDVEFFKSYESGITVGEMLTQAQNYYINDVGRDYFTIEEFILFGDPSLIVGGYE